MSNAPVDLPAWFAEYAGLNGNLKANQVPQIVDRILSGARRCGASDIHLRPHANGLQMRWRIDGVVQTVADFPVEIATNFVARLKVLANLLTYRTDVPQEGRVTGSQSGLETRISVFPTQYGEKVVIRLFAESGNLDRLQDLNLPAEVEQNLDRLLEQTSGVILLTGPAGSGKTTTIYAAMREIIHKSGGERSLVSLEDPVEVILPEVDQTGANPKAGLDMMTGLRSLVRQDPDVIMVGEIRDRETAETVFQASLIGNLVLTTYHAGSCTRALGRLSDMGIEPYLLRSGLLAVFSQRLLRTLCNCKQLGDATSALSDVELTQAAFPVGCEICRGTGYRGRRVISEYLDPDETQIADAILRRLDVKMLNERASESGMITLRQRALELVNQHLTSPLELIRVLGK
ncbi:MAG: type II/IV secretion system protein [Planctomycetaceae bacterium]|nr:type II/IV secretion system protein [Planctomycetaceae bacterium]